jgi:hypothetical protein
MSLTPNTPGLARFRWPLAALLVLLLGGAVLTAVLKLGGPRSTHISPSAFPLAARARVVLSFDDPPVDAYEGPQNYDRWLIVKGPPGMSETDFQAAAVARLRAASWAIAGTPTRVTAKSRKHRIDLVMASGANATIENKAGRFPMPVEVELALRRFGRDGVPLLAVDLYHA